MGDVRPRVQRVASRCAGAARLAPAARPRRVLPGGRLARDHADPSRGVRACHRERADPACHGRERADPTRHDHAGAARARRPASRIAPARCPRTRELVLAAVVFLPRRRAASRAMRYRARLAAGARNHAPVGVRSRARLEAGARRCARL